MQERRIFKGCGCSRADDSCSGVCSRDERAQEHNYPPSPPVAPPIEARTFLRERFEARDPNATFLFGPMFEAEDLDVDSAANLLTAYYAACRSKENVR
jgi:hypothetical protein